MSQSPQLRPRERIPTPAWLPKFPIGVDMMEDRHPNRIGASFTAVDCSPARPTGAVAPSRSTRRGSTVQTDPYRTTVAVTSTVQAAHLPTAGLVALVAAWTVRKPRTQSLVEPARRSPGERFPVSRYTSDGQYVQDLTAGPTLSHAVLLNPEFANYLECSHE